MNVPQISLQIVTHANKDNIFLSVVQDMPDFFFPFFLLI